jgi:hypothetical protein
MKDWQLLTSAIVLASLAILLLSLAFGFTTALLIAFAFLMLFSSLIMLLEVF